MAAQWLRDKVYNHFATGQLSIQFTYTGPAELVYGEVALAAAGSSVITSSGTVPIGPTVTPRTYTLSVPFATAIAGVYTMFVAMWKDDSKVNSVWNNADDQGRQQAIARVIVNP